MTATPHAESRSPAARQLITAAKFSQQAAAVATSDSIFVGSFHED